RAQPCQGWGRGFESLRPLHVSQRNQSFSRREKRLLLPFAPGSGFLRTSGAAWQAGRQLGGQLRASCASSPLNGTPPLLFNAQSPSFKAESPLKDVQKRAPATYRIAKVEKSR